MLIGAALSSFPAQAITLTDNSSTDAGSTLSTALLATGSGSLTQIDGWVSSRDADLFGFSVLGGALSINVTSVFPSSFDTQLFLFDALGRGVASNDDANNTRLSSLSFSNLAAGTYYLAVTGFDYDPVSNGTYIFSNTYTGQQTPLTQSPLTGFQCRTGSCNYGGDYTILLSGAQAIPSTPAPIPAPGPALGLLALGGIRGLTRLWAQRSR